MKVFVSGLGLPCAILAITCLCGCGKSGTVTKTNDAVQAETSPSSDVVHSAMAEVEQSQEQEEQRQNIAALEQAIVKAPSAESIGEKVVIVEGMIVDHIRKNGPGDRFVIKTVSAEEESQAGSLCLHANPNGGAMVKTEFPGDKIRIDLSFAGVVAYGEGSRWVPNIFRQTSQGIVATEDIPSGDGSLHRYAGAIPLGVGVDYVFIAETN